MSDSVQSFFLNEKSTEETLVIKVELLGVFHNVVHGLSYKSLNCQMKLSQNIYADSKIAWKISCGRTKAVVVVLGLFSQHLLEDLNDGWHYSVSSDAPNIGNIKPYHYARTILLDNDYQNFTFEDNQIDVFFYIVTRLLAPSVGD